MSSDEESDIEAEKTAADDAVVGKYSMAGEFTNETLKQLISKCVEGASVRELCEFGDKTIEEKVGGVFKKEKELKKGIAFPTCVSVNNCVAYYSPLRSDEDKLLKDGDLVKIELGAQIDGFAAVAAHSLVVGASKEKKVTGRKADAIVAAYHAAEAAIRLIKADQESTNAATLIAKTIEEFHCKPIEGWRYAIQLRQHALEAEKYVIVTPTEAQKKDLEKHRFERHEAYQIDVIVSTGDGKLKESDTKTTVFRRSSAIVYQLKMKASRQFLSDVEKRSSDFAFSLRSFDDEKHARLGVIECAKHGLVSEYPVMHEKDNEFVARFKFTVLLMPTGPLRITGLNDASVLDLYQSEYKVENAEVKALLSQAVRKAGKKKKKSAAPKAPAAEQAKA